MEEPMSILGKFIHINNVCCEAIHSALRYEKTDAYHTYIDEVKAKLLPHTLIYDIGGGKTCPYLEDRERDFIVYALDISSEELKTNDLVDKKICTDVTKAIPTPDGQPDVITSRYVLEHLNDQQAFVSNAYAALKPGGYFIHVFPCKYALFSMINQLLPKDFAKKVLFTLKPASKSTSGFPAYYDKTNYSAFNCLLKKTGFTDLDFKFQYVQSNYFSFFLPLYLITYFLWDFIWFVLDVKDMAAYICVVAKKPD